MTRFLSRRRLASERMQRLRERQRAEVQIAPTPYTNDIVGLLLDSGLLAVADSEDRQQVGVALFRYMKEEAAKAVTR